MSDPRSLLADARQRLEGTTEGPWETDLYYVTAEIPQGRPGGEVIVQCRPTITRPPGYPEAKQVANAAFIAASRSLVPALCEALESALTKLESLEGIIERAGGVP